ncbi:MAG: methionyl-tRNA formyltransferase [Acidimicrobiales bacterium]
MARLVYLGSPPAAVIALDALVGAGHEVALVVSQPDKRRGRGGAVTSSPVKRAALDMGLAVTDRLDDVVAADAALGVVVAYGRMIPAQLLQVLPMVNIHFSLLPRWRGAAPVERAILAGDRHTGVCVMRIDEGLDTGPVLRCRSVPMGDEHAGVLTERLARLGVEMLVDFLAGGVGALPPGDAQVGDPTYAAKLDPREFRLDWARAATELHRVVRLDRAWTTFRGQRLRVRRATARQEPTSLAPGTMHGGSVSTGAGVLELHEVQPEGKRPMPAADWWRGVRPAPGERLGSEEEGR